MSYYRPAGSMMPNPRQVEEIITTPILQNAALAPRRDMFEIVEETLSPNASTRPLAMSRPPSIQRHLLTRQPLVDAEGARVRATMPTVGTSRWDQLVHCHWYKAIEVEGQKPVARYCGFVQTPESVYCQNHICRAKLADGTPCPNGVKKPTTSRICDGYHEENGNMALVIPTPQQLAQRDADRKIARLEKYVHGVKWAAERWPDLEKEEVSPSSSIVAQLEEEIRQIKLASPAHRSHSLPSMSEVLGHGQAVPSRMVLPPYFSQDGRLLAANSST